MTKDTNRNVGELKKNQLLDVKVTLNIDDVCFLEKPEKRIIGGIRNRLAKGTRTVNVSKLMEHIERGRSFTPAAMSGTDGGSWRSQQIIVADIDNDEPVFDDQGIRVKGVKKPVDSPLTSADALQICIDNGIIPTFMYHTFNNGIVLDGKKLEKYRIVCVLDQPVFDKAEGAELTNRLSELLEKDHAGALDYTMADAARLILGSTSGSIFYTGDSLASIEALRALPPSNRPTSGSNKVNLIARDATEFIMPSHTELEYIQLYNRAAWFREWSVKHKVDILRSIEQGDGTMIYAVVCPWSDQHSEDTGERQSAVIIRPNGVIQYVCQHAHCREKRKWKDFRAFYERNDKEAEPAVTMAESTVSHKANKSELSSLLKELHPENNNRYRWSDIGNGNLFADVYKYVARYCADRGLWYVYDGKRWMPDSKDGIRAMQLCKKLADALVVYSTTIENEKYAQAAAKWQSRNTRNNILKDAQGCYPVSASDLDKDIYLLNCKNGTLDLETLSFRKHDPRDMISKMANVYYDPGAHCSRWDAFVNEIVHSDTEKARFLQKALGYGLTGDTQEECFFILYGATSRNGKGTLMESYKNIMGDYGRAASPESIAQKDRFDSQKPSEDIARLNGARFVNISEPDKSLVLSSALVKTLTGNDTIQARYLHENSFEFKPQFKLFINTNHLPRVTDPTVFGSDRVKVIPFSRHFEEHERDTGLKRLFTQKDNASAILNWCIAGLKAYQSEGLSVPESVKVATKEYMLDSDVITRFMDDELVLDYREEVQTSEAYDRYKKWCERNGFYQQSIKTFSQELKLRNVEMLIKRPREGGNPCSIIIARKLR